MSSILEMLPSLYIHLPHSKQMRTNYLYIYIYSKGKPDHHGGLPFVYSLIMARMMSCFKVSGLQLRSIQQFGPTLSLSLSGMEESAAHLFLFLSLCRSSCCQPRARCTFWQAERHGQRSMAQLGDGGLHN